LVQLEAFAFEVVRRCCGIALVFSRAWFMRAALLFLEWERKMTSIFTAHPSRVPA